MKQILNRFLLIGLQSVLYLACLSFSLMAAAATFTVSNTNDSGSGSLRQAILNSNATLGTNTIVFDLPGTGTHTIFPASDLPIVTTPVKIDGTTQPGFAGTPVIELNGGYPNLSLDYGLQISAGNSTICGLVINRFAGVGIDLTINGGNVITGNYIGTDVTGAIALTNNGAGIYVSCANNTIGGLSPAARNVLSGNDYGIYISRTSGNRVYGNYIGTDATGTQMLQNDYGVVLDGASGTLLGGTSQGSRNVISGNSTGIWIINDLVAPNVIQGNYIGTDATGTMAVPNWYGISTDAIVSSSNTIGGTTAAARNIVSGNLYVGILIQDTSEAQIKGNFIGTDVTGLHALGNGADGIRITGDSFSSGSHNITIGGTDPGAANVIAYNGFASGGDGVRIGDITGDGVTGCAILSNSIYSNYDLGIDLGGDGVTPNDFSGHTGPNNFQNFPILTGVSYGYGNTTVQGTLNSAPSTTFRLEFFAAPTADPSGFGQGNVFLGFSTVKTDGSGNSTWKVTLPVTIPVHQVISATATDPANNTSEFSPCYPGLQASAPVLSFVSVPSFGTFSAVVQGKAFNVKPTDYKVALFIFVPGLGWYSKPTLANPTVGIQSNQSWSGNIDTGGVDDTASQVAAYLLPTLYNLPIVFGADSIPTDIEQHAVAKLVRIRPNVNQRQLRFSGYDWLVKSNRVPVGPGLNHFTESAENVWVDSQGKLHLRITNRNGKWYCPEILSKRSLGYGTYRFYLDSPVDQLDPNVVLGLFTWSDNSAFSHREIDLEYSRWGQANNQNAQFVVQPFSNSQNINRFQIPSGVDTSTQIFQWQKNRVSFQSLKGHNANPPDANSIVNQWSYAQSSGVPPLGDQQVHMNLWLLGGQAPTDGQEVEIVISRFEFVPPATVDINRDGLNDLLFQNIQTSQVGYWFMNGSSVLSGGPESLLPAANYRVVGAGDFNGDGQPDIVFQNIQTGQVGFWFMNGTTVLRGTNATFPNGTPALLPPGYQVVGVGDFNDDGQLDLVLQNQYTGQVAFWFLQGTIVLGGGDASVTADASWTVVGAGDLNHDGLPDLILQNQGTGQVAFWTMNGSVVTSGNFAALSPSSTWRIAAVGNFSPNDQTDLIFQNLVTGQVAFWYMDGILITSSEYASLLPPPGWKVFGPR